MSLARANAIAEALMREGLRSENVQAAAQGSAVPVYYEFTPTGEAGNRRAEIYLVN
jgi:outer membrane protein OmpA-like peptidoglycan-associated protein